MRPKADILAEVREAADAGAAKFSCWDRSSITTQAPDDPSCDFTALLEAIHDVPRASSGSALRARTRDTSPTGFWTRWLGFPKVCRHLHLPVQSGFEPVLEAMRRRYTRESYLDLVAAHPRTLPDVALSTDMIVGFPGRDRGGFRGHAVADHGRPAITACSRSSIRPGQIRWPTNGWPTTYGDEEKTRRIVALQGVQREIQSRLNETRSARPSRS